MVGDGYSTIHFSYFHQSKSSTWWEANLGVAIYVGGDDKDKGTREPWNDADTEGK
jgi:hypothetical protein